MSVLLHTASRDPSVAVLQFHKNVSTQSWSAGTPAVAMGIKGIFWITELLHAVIPIL